MQGKEKNATSTALILSRGMVIRDSTVGMSCVLLIRPLSVNEKTLCPWSCGDLDIATSRAQLTLLSEAQSFSLRIIFPTSMMLKG